MPSYNLGELIGCPRIQSQLEDTEMVYSLPIQAEQINTLETVLTGINRQQFRAIPGYRNAKKQVYKLVYPLQVSPNDAGFTTDTYLDCAGGEKPTDNSMDYELDLNVGTKVSWTIDIAELMDGCESDEFYVTRTLRQYINAASWKMNNDLLAKIIANKGNFASTGNSTALDLSTQTTAGAFTTKFRSTILNELQRKNMMRGPFFVLGGSANDDFTNYWDAEGVACCNTVLGENLRDYSQAYGGLIPIYEPNATDSVMGARQFITMGTGAVQFVGGNKTSEDEGVRNNSDSTWMKYPITDPETGLRWDFQAKEVCADGTDGVVNFTLSKPWDAWFMPNDRFKDNDPFNRAGVNGINQFRVVDPS